MQPRDLPVEGRDLDGIHFAMEFLTQQNKINRGMISLMMFISTPKTAMWW